MGSVGMGGGGMGGAGMGGVGMGGRGGTMWRYASSKSVSITAVRGVLCHCVSRVVSWGVWGDNSVREQKSKHPMPPSPSGSRCRSGPSSASHRAMIHLRITGP